MEKGKRSLSQNTIKGTHRRRTSAHVRVREEVRVRGRERERERERESERVGLTGPHALRMMLIVNENTSNLPI